MTPTAIELISNTSFLRNRMAAQWNYVIQARERTDIDEVRKALIIDSALKQYHYFHDQLDMMINKQ